MTSEEGPNTDFSYFDCFNKRGLHCIHLNARSLLPKIHELRHIVQKTSAFIIGITESWLDSTISDSEINIPGYIVVRQDRNREGGGVCIFIKEDLAFNHRKDLYHEKLEMVWVEILFPHCKPLLIGSCYRPPDMSDFYKLFEECCYHKEFFSDLETIVLRDFNSNALKQQSNMFSAVKHLMFIFNWVQLINTPTRITPTSESCLDLIFVSHRDKISQSGVINIGLSDHFLTYCTRKVQRGSFNTHNSVRIRSMKNYSSENFLMELNKINWFQVTDIEDVNKAWALFHNLFIKVLNRVAPIKQVRLKQRSKPWMDGHILDLINQRDQALHNYRKSKIADDFKHFSKLRNKVQYSIRKAKRHFDNNKIEDHKNSSSDLWKTLKSLGTSSKIKSGSTSIGLTLDKLKVADTFNAFFTTVANKLVSKLPKAANIFNSKFIHQYYKQKGVVQNAFSFSLLSETEVCKMLKGLSPRKATGLDDLPARFIRDGAEGIAYPISYMINLSLKTGVVPDEMKTARVIPLYKKNSKLEMGNYRPVSILSTLSKVLERAVHIQLEIYLKEIDLFYKF